MVNKTRVGEDTYTSTHLANDSCFHILSGYRLQLPYTTVNLAKMFSGYKVTIEFKSSLLLLV